MRCDYHVHAVAHGEYSYDYPWIASFARQARLKGIQEIGFTEHDEFHSRIDESVIERVRQEFPDVGIRLGLEVDYIPGREEAIKVITSALPYDYLLGSVHFINGWGFDHPDFRDKFAYQDIDEIYSSYFNLVRDAAESGLFDVIAHLDLIKIWGYRPAKRHVLHYVEPVLKSIKEQGLVIEINSSGLRKPVEEIYPARDILELMKTMNILVTLGSDAHYPAQVGKYLDNAIQLARSVGYSRMVKYDRRRIFEIPL